MFVFAAGKAQSLQEFQLQSLAPIFVFYRLCEGYRQYDCKHYFHYLNNSKKCGLEFQIVTDNKCLSIVTHIVTELK